MPRLLTALAGLVVAVSFVPAAPVPTHLLPRDPPLNFPTAVGTEWVYELTGGGTQTIVISEAKVEADGSRLVTTEYVENGKRTPHQTKRVSSSGVFVVVDHGQAYTQPVCIVKLPHREGETWETRHRCVGDPAESNGRRVVGRPGKIRVPYGEVSALRIDWELDGTKGTNWYIDGIGAVKVGDYMQLKSFTAGKR